ncbi:MAG: hypothetical protein ACTSRA_20520, partial [Promethearchaeota archaeon]
MIKKKNLSNKDKEKLFVSLMQLIPQNFFIENELPAIIQGDKIIIRSVFGLSLFLKAWLEQEEINVFFMNDVSKIINDLDTYLQHCQNVLKFIYKKGRVPERDEAWDLNIPIDDVDLVLNMINVNVKSNVINRMSQLEIKYYDTLSKKLIINENKLDSLKLEHLVSKYKFNLIDAKIIPQFINDLVNIEDLNSISNNYLDLESLNENDVKALNKFATKIVKNNMLEKGTISVLELARTLKISLLDVHKTLYLLNNPEKFMKHSFTDEKEIELLSRQLSKAIKLCRSQKIDLNVNMLVTEFNLDFINANNIITLYGTKFNLPSPFTRKEYKSFDECSRIAIKYIKEINKNPTVDDLMIDLNFNVKIANTIFAFINMISTEPFHEDLTEYPENVLMKIDDLATKILIINKEERQNIDLIDLAYKLNSGIYSIKRAIAYISWIEKIISIKYINALSSEYKKNIQSKIKEALRYIKENNLD